jgi:hypothetical protein
MAAMYVGAHWMCQIRRRQSSDALSIGCCHPMFVTASVGDTD